MKTLRVIKNQGLDRVTYVKTISTRVVHAQTVWWCLTFFFSSHSTIKSVIPVELPEGKSGQQALAVEKLQKRAELMGAIKTGTWCVNCETYQAVTTFSKSFYYNMAELVHGEKELSNWFPEKSELFLLCGLLRWIAHDLISLICVFEKIFSSKLFGNK